MNGFSTETALCTMKVTNFSRLSKLIAKNTPDYVLGEHRTVGVDVGGSLGKVPCSEELARQIQGPGVSSYLGSAKPVRKVPFSQLFKRVGKPAWPIVHLFLSSERAS